MQSHINNSSNDNKISAFANFLTQQMENLSETKKLILQNQITSLVTNTLLQEMKEKEQKIKTL